MAIIYVRSTDGDDADNGSTWALAKATLTGALAIAVAGDTIYVSQAHAETTAAPVTLTSAGTAALPIRIICVNDGAEPPTAVAATATVSTTGGSALTLEGHAYWEGIAFQAASGSSNGSLNLLAAAAAGFGRFVNCTFKLNTTSVSPRMNFGATSGSGLDQALEFINCVFNFGAVAQTINPRCSVTIEGGSLAGTVPTTLFLPVGSGPIGPCVVTGMDLSTLNTNLVTSTASRRFLFQDCKLHASVTVAGAAIAGFGNEVVLVNCDSGDTNYKYHKANYRGVITEDITVYRTSGSTDGTTHFSRKFVSSANTNFFAPLVGDWMYFWNETVGSVTAAVEVATDNVTLTDAEAWVEVEALTTSGFPLGAIASDRAATILTTPANQTTSVVAWTAVPGTPVTQVLSKAVTVAEKGIVRARVCLARASTTMYADALILSGSGRQYSTGASGIINEGASSSSRPFFLG